MVVDKANGVPGDNDVFAAHVTTQTFLFLYIVADIFVGVRIPPVRMATLVRKAKPWLRRKKNYFIIG